MEWRIGFRKVEFDPRMGGSIANPGVSSQPSEIGYYGNAAICGDGTVLADKCADQLGVKLDKSLHGRKLRGVVLLRPGADR